MNWKKRRFDEMMFGNVRRRSRSAVTVPFSGKEIVRERVTG